MRLPLAILRALFSFGITITLFLAAMASPRAADVIANESAKVTATAQLTCAPVHLRFGRVTVGQTKTSVITLTNSGGPSITISEAIVVGTAFSLSGLNVPAILSERSRLTFSASFTPQSNRTANGTIYIISNASNPVLTIPLAGTGTDAGQLVVAPATIDFGNVPVGSSEPQTGTLSAVGSAVTVSSGTISSSEFTLSGLSFPVTIPVGESASFTVTFTPQSSGFASATLTFVSDASNSPTVESLTGTGTPPYQYTVGLSWTASTSQDVVGYNIYRGNTSGGPYTKINFGLDANTNYTDNSVQSGHTYYYVTTAVDSQGTESSYSNQAQAVIPIPVVILQ